MSTPSAPQVISAGIKQYYQENTQGSATLDKFLFPIADDQLVGSVAVDMYKGGGNYASRVAAQDGSANNRDYVAGSGYNFSPPLIREKTPIPQSLLDKVIAGMTAEQNVNLQREALIEQILLGSKNGLYPSAYMTRNKSAIDVLRLGQMRYTNSASQDTVAYDFDRDPQNNTTYDTTAAGASFDKALTVALAGPKSHGMPRARVCVILGENWLDFFNSDSRVSSLRTSNGKLLVNDDLARMDGAAEGLVAIGSYAPASLGGFVKIFSYQPDNMFLRSAGGTAEEYVPANEMLIFKQNDTGFRFNRAVEVLGNNNESVTSVGDYLLDGYVSYDPVVSYIRMSMRYFFAFGEINHTARCVGTF